MLAYTQPGFTSIPMSDVSSSCVGENCRHVDWWMLGYPVMLDQSATGYVGLPVVLLVNMHNKHNVNGECSGRFWSMWLITTKIVIIIALIYGKLCSKEISGIEHFKGSSMQFF